MSLPDGFVHLHNHTAAGSLLDGLPSPAALVARAKELGQRAVALTDHGSLSGIPAFNQECAKQGIQPILGLEAYAAARRAEDRLSSEDKEHFHLTLLAENETGWRNLIRLSSRSYLEGFYGKPRIDEAMLEQHHEGLICLSGCWAGKVPTLLRTGDERRAREVASWYRDLFGDRYYIELHDHHLQDQDALCRSLVDLARRLDIPVVAANDAHYARPEDWSAHDVLLCVQMRKQRRQYDRLRFESTDFYLKSAAEMRDLFNGLDEALRNTLAIAERCDWRLEHRQHPLPDFPIPGGLTPLQYLRKQVTEGLRWRYGEPTREHLDRAEYELGVIERTGYATYFLIVQDFVRWSREQGIMAVPRGSVAGSICIYALGICDIDPLRYGLMFERFLHEERKGMPDIDMDFADDRRDEVIGYIERKYGHDHVAQIAAFSTMGAKTAIRDVGRAIEADHGLIEQVCRQIPSYKTTLEEARGFDGIVSLARDYPPVREVLEIASALTRTPRAASTHAAGIVITREPVAHIAPLMRATRVKGDKAHSGGVLPVVQWVWQEVEEAGILKMDVLGVTALSTVSEAQRLIEQDYGSKLDLYNLPDDYEHNGRARETFDMLARGETTACFQVNSAGMRGVLRGMRPTRIMDLMAAVALYRPGPMDHIPEYNAAKNGETEIVYPHPDLEEILRPTYGQVVFQDQVLLMVRKMAHYSWGEADVLRKAMGKKLPALMIEQQTKFLERMAQAGHPESLAEKLWEIISPFSGYGFPAAHAAAYAVMAYITAYLKTNYPAQYMTAYLTHEAGDTAKVAEAVSECRRLGVPVLPLDVNRSVAGFATEPRGDQGVPGIRFGLSAVKYAGVSTVQGIVEEREANGPYSTVLDLCRRLGTRSNAKSLRGLAMAGAMDCLGERAAVVAALDDMTKLGPWARVRQDFRIRERGQLSLVDSLTGRGIAQVADAAFTLPGVPRADRRQRLRWEQEATGLYITEHPLQRFARIIHKKADQTAATLSAELIDQAVIVGGRVVSLRVVPTKRGDEMALLDLEDFEGTIPVVLYPRMYESCRSFVNHEAVLLIDGVAGMHKDQVQVVANDVRCLDEGMVPESAGGLLHEEPF